MKTRDALGREIDDEAEYFIRDTRRHGDSVTWWGNNSVARVHDINLAGRYSGARVRSMRHDNDAPWPVSEILQVATLHVEVQHLPRRPLR